MNDSRTRQPDETYFPPQKIFVVITRLERLKKGKWKRIFQNICHAGTVRVEKKYIKKGEERQHILALLHVNWEIMPLYFILSTSHTPTSHNKCDCAKTGPAPLNDVGELPDRATQILNQARQSRRQGTKGSSFIQHLFGREDGRRECGRGRLHESFISQPASICNTQYVRGRRWYKIRVAGWEGN